MITRTLPAAASIALLCIGTRTSEANLIAYWPFEDGQGNVVGDVVGGFDGTASGGTWVAGREGSFAYESTGGNEIACGPDPSPNTQDLSLAWWMIDNQVSWGTILDKSVAGSRYGYNILVRPSNEDSPLRFRIGGWQQTYGPWPEECRVPVGAYNDGEWVHVVCTYDSASDTASIYINGQLPANGAFNPKTGIAGDGGYCDGVNNVGAPLFIRGGEETFNGVLDEVAIWDRALTADEVMTVYALGPLSVEVEQRFAITAMTYDPESNQLALTWDSREGEAYAIKYSGDMTNWEDDLDDGIPAAPGESSTSATFDLGDAGIDGEESLFFRVEKVQP